MHYLVLYFLATALFYSFSLKGHGNEPDFAKIGAA
jgi:hypothetical protein